MTRSADEASDSEYGHMAGSGTHYSDAPPSVQQNGESEGEKAELQTLQAAEQQSGASDAQSAHSVHSLPGDEYMFESSQSREGTVVHEAQSPGNSEGFQNVQNAQSSRNLRSPQHTI